MINGKGNMKIEQRVLKTAKLYHQIKRNFLTKKAIGGKKTKLTVFKTIYKPTLTFGCENWVIGKREKSRIQTQRGTNYVMI